ncbi:MAG TPA: Lrp/AsnC family transcriptional regulator [Candidatus Desulfaltia sp.]|nr:Lrp/AsnC family transcriptional regulator [Candidatus Desulfaltia sp.]
MDDTDRTILRMLKEDARVSLAQISREVGLSSPSIKDRIDKLEAEGVILGYRPVLEYGKLGLGLTGFVGVMLDPQRCCDEDIVRDLETVEGVVEGWFTDGEEDMLLMVRAADPPSLMETVNRIRSIQGVYRTRTVITLANPIKRA